MSLIAELKRRNVFRVGVAYGVVAWLLLEVASVVVPALHLPEWTLTFLVFLVAAGLPLALVFAWAFEMTPEGIKREKDVDSENSITHVTGRKLDFAIIGLLAVAVVYFAVEKFVLEAEPKLVTGAAEQALGRTPVASEASIAVLPFANRSANEADAFFVDGMHDDILTHLAKIRSLKVISRTSVMEYRNTTKNLKTIGQELGAATVLEGGVQRAGTQIRVNVQLIDAETDDHLWAEIYDRQLTAENIFAIQTEIAMAIADALRATLSTEEKERLETVPTENMAALEAYFRGKQRMEKRNIEKLAEAIGDFNRAIALDPNFALAYVGLADTYILQADYSNLPLDELLAKAQAATEKALALDDQLAEAYTSLGGIEHDRSNYEAAEAAYQRALELNPNYVTAYHWYSILLSGPLGRSDEAFEMIQKAAELDPNSSVIIQNLAISYANVGRSDESLARLRKLIEIDPDFIGGYVAMAFHYWGTEGRLDEAARWFRKAVPLEPGSSDLATALGTLFLDLGDLDRAEYWIERSIELAPESFDANLAMQQLYLYRGDLAVALEIGRRIYEKDDIRGFRSYFSWPVRIDEMRTGRFLEARAAFEEIAPEFLNDDTLEINSPNRQQAIDFALILSKLGEQERADRLLERIRQSVQQPSRIAGGTALVDAHIYAVQGDEQKALTALQRAIDEGWRIYWWFSLKFDPTLKSLHDEPEFQAMIAEIEADMAVQRAREREMEKNGELEPIPEILVD